MKYWNHPYVCKKEHTDNRYSSDIIGISYDDRLKEIKKSKPRKVLSFLQLEITLPFAKLCYPFGEKLNFSVTIIL